MSDEGNHYRPAPPEGGGAPVRRGRMVGILAAVAVVAALGAVVATFAISNDGSGGGSGPQVGGSGEPVSVPASCRPEATNSGTEIRRDWPTDATTGPDVDGLDEDNLPASGHPSTWEITDAGTTVKGVFHHGRIVVQAPDVTIEDSVVCGTGAVIVQTESPGLTIRNTIVVGEVGTSMENADAQEPCSAGVGYGDYTVERSEVMNCADGLKVADSVTVEDSYFHDQYTYRGGASGQEGGGTHNDTVQYQSDDPLSHFVFEGNAAYQDPCTSNRHFQMAPNGQGSGSGGTWRIDGNFFYGIKVLNVDRGVRVDDGAFTDNTMAGSAEQGPFGRPMYASGDLGGVKVSGNRYEDGSAADDNYDGDYECTKN